MYTNFDPRVAHLIRVKPRVLARLGRCRPCDVDDLQQDVAVHLLRKLPRHDPSRSSLLTFASMLIDRRLANAIARLRCPRRDWRRERPLCRAHRLGRRDYRLRDLELRLDVAVALTTLPDELRLFADRIRLGDGRPVSAARELGLSRSQMRGRLHRLRRHFERSGVTP